MKKEELYKEIDTNNELTQYYLGLPLVKFLSLLIVIITLGIYIGNILYGTNSVKVLFGLENYQEYIEDEIVKLKSENAELQKEYFELKEISAD